MARASGLSASGRSEPVRRLQAQLGVRLLNRTTRSVAPTEAGERLLERLSPALTEVEWRRVQRVPATALPRIRAHSARRGLDQTGET
jgi:DNA-binding transcriptional LysR family regulator